jgi:hypothetical protein
MLDRIEEAMTFGSPRSDEAVGISKLKQAVESIIDEEIIARGMTMLRALYGIEDKVREGPAIIQQPPQPPSNPYSMLGSTVIDQAILDALAALKSQS